MSALTLKVVSPDGLNRTVECDGVILWMAPDRSGKGEGSIGIRKDHVNAVIALGSGKIEAHLDGKTVYSGRSEGGFATVLDNTVTVVTRQTSPREE